MIWIACSIFISTIILCCTILFIKLGDNAYASAMYCLEELCDTLNKKFPGSTLKVVNVKGDIRVKGEFKYIKRNGE